MAIKNNAILPNLTESRGSVNTNLRSEHANTVSINVIKRIMDILYDNGRLKRTNLAGMSGLNYNKCIRYLKLLHTLGWIRILFEDGSCFVTITDRGIETIERLENFN